MLTALNNIYLAPNIQTQMTALSFSIQEPPEYRAETCCFE
jgi:hypothetical protein